MKPNAPLLRLASALLLFFIMDFAIGRMLLTGANERYGITRHSKILLIGHSHLMLAADEDMMREKLDVDISKYTREGVNVADRQMMVKQYLDSEYSDSLRLVLYGVDLCTFTGGKSLADNSYTLFYPFMNNDMISMYVNGQTSASNYWLHKLIKSYRFNDDGMKNGSLRGLLHDNRNLKTGVVDIDSYKARLARGDERHIMMDESLMRIFDETIQSITSRGIRVALINTPTLDLLNDFEPGKYQIIVDWFQHYADTHTLVEYWDFNPEYSSHHELFHDRLHLNADGQKVITDELILKIKEIDL